MNTKGRKQALPLGHPGMEGPTVAKMSLIGTLPCYVTAFQVTGSRGMMGSFHHHFLS